MLLLSAPAPLPSHQQVRELVRGLHKDIIPVGVFVNAPPELPAQLLNEGTLEIAQLHGNEDEAYIHILREMTDKPLIQACKSVICKC